MKNGLARQENLFFPSPRELFHNIVFLYPSIHFFTGGFSTMDAKIKMLVMVLIAVTLLSIGISYSQQNSLNAVLAAMSVNP